MSAKNVIVNMLNDIKRIKYFTLDYFAIKYNISKRTVYRNFDILKDSGYNIKYDRKEKLYYIEK